MADREGAAAVTMRRLGAELGVDPTAVYRHFRNKQALLDAMADHLFARVRAEFTDGPDWRENLRESLLLGFRLYRTHPGLAISLARSHDDLNSLTELSELMIRDLRAAGLSDRDAAWTFHSLVDVVVGTGLFCAVAPDSNDSAARAQMRRTIAALPPETHANVVAVATDLYPDDDDIFRHTVELMLEAIELRASRVPANHKENTS